jgi:GNAT superfamily N-acetyltransferase
MTLAARSKPKPMIRDAREGDRRRLAEIMKATWREIWAPHMPGEADKAWRGNTIAEYFVDQLWTGCLVAMVEDAIAGFALLSEDEVTTLHVDPIFKRQGIGKALMMEAETRVRSQGHQRLRIEAEAFNTDAHAFYAALGYVETRRFTGNVVGFATPCLELVKTLKR